jgi:hypothetical protein
LSCSTRPCRTISASSVARCSGTRAHNEAFFIPKSFGTSTSWTGGAEAALWPSSFLSELRWFYTRPGGLLQDMERPRGAKEPALGQAQLAN